MRSAEVEAIILQSSKLFMDFNFGTPFDLKYLGPFSIANKLSLKLKGVPPYNMDENEVKLYEETFLGLANDTLTQSDPPIYVTSAKVTEQILSPANETLEVYTEILAFFDTSFDFETTAIKKISAVSQSIPIVYHLKASGNTYFSGLMGASMFITNVTAVTNSSYLSASQDEELVIPSYPSLSESQPQLSGNRYTGGSVAAILGGLVILVVTVGVVHGFMRKTQQAESVGKNANTTDCVLSPCTLKSAEVNKGLNIADLDSFPRAANMGEVIKDCNNTDPGLSPCTSDTVEVDEDLDTTHPDLSLCTTDTIEP